MAQVRITELPESLTLDNNSVFPMVFNNITQKITFKSLKDVMIYYTSVEYDETTGKFTFTRSNNSKSILPTNLYKAFKKVEIINSEIVFTDFSNNTFNINPLTEQIQKKLDAITSRLDIHVGIIQKNSSDIATNKSNIEKNASDIKAINDSKGEANGFAELDSNGQVPSSQLPSYVDDVIEGYLYNNEFYKDNSHTILITGETGKIYVDLITEKTYRWSGSTYAVISETLALGETSSTAYRGDRGKVSYDHSQTIGNPHQTTKADIGLGNVDNTADADKTVKEAGKVSHFIKIQRNGSLLGQFNGSSEIITNIEVPTKTSEITNDSDFVNSQGTIAVAKKVGTSTVGGSTTPVYINEGTPTPIGYTISKSVPADAVFTDTTYSNATQSQAGLMSALDKTKLDGVSENADKVEWQQNVNTGVNIANVTINGVKTEIYAPTSAQYKGDMEKSVYDTNNDGVVDEASKTTGTLTIQQNQVDIDSFDGSVDKTINILIPKNATQDTAGLMSPEDKTKLDNISTSSMPIGSGCDYFGTEAPEGFLFADGSAISRTKYSELFAIIGTIYGAGDGSTTFNLPDKRTRVSVPMKADDDTFNKLGKTGGEKTHKLTISEIPSHNHGVSIVSASNTWGPNYQNGVSHKESTKNVGGEQPHNNLPPYLVCNYIIKVN